MLPIALPAKRWFTPPKRPLSGLRIYKTYRRRSGQPMLRKWPSDGSSHKCSTEYQKISLEEPNKAESTKLPDAGISPKPSRENARQKKGIYRNQRESERGMDSDYVNPQL